MGPNNTKNSSFKCDFLIFNYEWYCQNLVFILKKPPNLIKKLFLCFVSKQRVGPINSQHNNFKWGNIFAGICTLVLWVNQVCLCRETLLKGKAQYNWPPHSDRWFCKKEIYNFSMKSSWSKLISTRRSTVQSLPLLQEFPGSCQCKFSCVKILSFVFELKYSFLKFPAFLQVYNSTVLGADSQ